jgi:hypothetical protein
VIAAMIKSWPNSGYSSADKVGHTMPSHSNEREGLINYPKPRISSDIRVIISAYLFRKIER